MKRAFASHDTKTLVELLKKGVDLHTPILQEEGKRAVHYAAHQGSLEMLQLLKERNVDMASPSPDGDTALHRAVAGDQIEAVCWLLSEGGLDVACRSKDGQTALDRAMELRKTYMADYLQKVAVERAMASGDTKTLVELLRKGVDIDLLIYLQSKDGIRAVHFAAFHGSLVMLQLLKERNVDMASTSFKGHTALHWAVTGDQFEAVRWLLSEGGLDIARRSTDGKTAFELAKSQGKTSIANYLQKMTHEAEDASKTRGRHEPLQGKETQKFGHEESQKQLNEKLLKEAEGGNLEAVKALLDKGADVEVASTARGAEKGLRPLHLATWGGHASVVRELLLRGAVKTARGANGYSLVHFAAKRGSVEVLEILREAKCNMKAKTDDSQTALHVAADHGNQAAVQWLVENDAIDLSSQNRDGDKALNLAQKSGHKSIADYLLMIQGQKILQKGVLNDVIELIAEGFDVNTVFQEGTNKGMTPLHLASWGGHSEVITVLLEHGADGNAKTAEGMTAMHLASMGGHVSSMETLATKCDFGSTNRDGKSALHLAAEYGNMDAVRWLTLQGHDVSQRDASGRTPFQYAKEEGQKKVAEFLANREGDTQNRRCAELHSAVAQGNLSEVRRILSQGVNLDTPSTAEGENGRHVLHTAALLGKATILRELLRAGAARDGKDSQGNTVVHYAAFHDDASLLSILHTEGVDVASAINARRETPLHIAASRGNLEVLEWLLQKGVPVNQKDAEGRTAEEVAALKRQCQAADTLSKSREENAEAQGLRSLGNTCYMNTIIQCLFHINEITTFFKDKKYAQHLVPSIQGRVTESFASVVEALIRGGNYSAVLNDFKSSVCAYDSLFAGDDQRDAHDFLSAFLFAARKEFQDQDDSPFSHLLFGKEQSVIRCLDCKAVVLRKEEIFSSLTLTIKPYKSGIRLQDLIADNYKEEQIEWDCKECKRKKCSRKVFIETLPKVLIIHFNRYTSSSKSFHKSPLSYPVTLKDMKEHMHKSFRSKGFDYQLRSVACHHGSMSGGHYTAICKRDDSWLLFSDERVQNIQSPHQREAHILFYEAMPERKFLGLFSS
ncbi:ankyrin-3-like isoform X2 [Penaeus japonicus]|uniref:ankyrin-3-like isoform X2 n=1 Tax=Penaeus japonicus TaxID=27405 RepID=UPI001C7158CE|nr:ankyrin-3-like isoform X2 [Penaeus japonicus]